MAWYTWVIIALCVLSFMQYAYPDKVNFVTEPVWGWVKDFVTSKNPLDNDSGITCPDGGNAVCGDDGTTYDNMCKAALAGVLDVTPGAC